MKLVRWNFFCLILLINCHSRFGSIQDLLGILQWEDTPKILSISPSSDSMNVKPETDVSILFSHPMSIQSCISAFSLEPQVRGVFETNDFSLKFIPKSELPSGGYVMKVTKQCEDKNGKDLDRVYTIPFRVGEKETPEPPELDSFVVLTGTESECLAGGNSAEIKLGEIVSVCSGIPGPPSLQVRFTKAMNQKEVELGLRIEPSLSYRLEWDNPSQFRIVPDTTLQPETRYRILFPKGIHASDGAELNETIQLNFLVGPDLSDPEVIGFGLESQNCGLGIQEIGSISGARWDSNSCFWSRGLPILSPYFYQFRGGDDGSGSSGANFACADVDTDNFRIFFNQYMDTTSVIGASKLSKISPPSTNIRLSTWVWSNCQTTFPFGCRELTYSYAESEASCNGSLFGNIATGGDFNLSASALSPNFYPYYEFRLEPEAKSISGKRMKVGFVIQLEAK
ncbi:Ig-like domain-containing protein [Leptospira sp. 2 VSF19]|uniref:Ig-like domain-containing protein n=1 Tax=Leptospira soteropolitanensis TaxID=2950025 RepID=A0AAW5VF52_9LEPT|nr:Ig-like domain-containing protein [Leptospira soteropolitanensis]MCW7493887.1 Ig-like domain-containing protein [Leptospira soteropolitanensis]MCW7501481.1 Ig-like domain-containing protein [Leptospira soteropolitanensis]MCW7523756.1 Ig-like domain-containing protein [Leptospira soteropolitanensis]MCW7527620.1 Ig-like domain-containing protein [Leptospira soteropolitanensis]MCW7531474.1 Ig-like domain-containing protein [Leptospira soteropolitanensis]